MNFKLFLVTSLAVFALGSSASTRNLTPLPLSEPPTNPDTTPPKPVPAEPFKLIKSDFKAGEVKAACEKALEQGKAKLDLVPQAQNPLLTFEKEVADIFDEIYPLTFMGYVSTDAQVREEASECEQKAGTFSVEIMTRKDLYEAIKKVTPSNGEEARLLSETKRSFENNGMSLSDEELAQFREKKSKLTEMEAQFSANLNEDTTKVLLTKEELEGLSEEFLKNKKQDEQGRYIITTKNTDYVMVMENAKKPETRKKMLAARESRAGEANTKLLSDAVVLRAEIAKIMGFKTWADYRTNGRMAQNSTNVLGLLTSLRTKLRERTQKDLNILLEEKKRLEDPNATQINIWDVTYFANQVKKSKYDLDDEVIRPYFPKDVVMAGLFEVYSQLLGVTYEEITNAEVWSPDVKLYAIKEKSDGHLIGYFYTDLVPRDGKYGHAAAFPLIGGRVLEDGKYSKPVAAIVANFAEPTADKPSLLNHDEVETLFHEFGHIMHQTLTSGRYASLSGSSVAQDFVEAPSQMLENWVWNSEILNKISGHYQDPSKKLPEDLRNKMIAAKDFNQGYFYSRQLALGLTDMTMHTQDQLIDVNATFRKVYEETVGIPALEGTSFMASFGHMMGGYDAGYYGYIWSEVYAADMFTRFEKGGLLSSEVGMSYRKNILEPGSMLEAMDLLKNFLGRDPNPDAFYKKLGI